VVFQAVVPRPATIYSCTDAQGNIFESSSPCSGAFPNTLGSTPQPTVPQGNQLGNGQNTGSCGGILNLPPSLCQGVTYKHLGLILAGAILVILGLGGLAFDKTVSGTKVLPV
jgi:hypothetical protein